MSFDLKLLRSPTIQIAQNPDFPRIRSSIEAFRIQILSGSSFEDDRRICRRPTVLNISQFGALGLTHFSADFWLLRRNIKIALVRFEVLRKDPASSFRLRAIRQQCPFLFFRFKAKIRENIYGHA